MLFHEDKTEEIAERHARILRESGYHVEIVEQHGKWEVRTDPKAITFKVRRKEHVEPSTSELTELEK